MFTHVRHEAEALDVVMKNDVTYRYVGVPDQEHEKLMASPSKGKHFAEHIKWKFPHLKIDPTECPKCGDTGPDGMTCRECGCSTYGTQE